MATCDFLLNPGTGPDEAIVRGTMLIGRVEEGDNGEMIVSPGLKNVTITYPFPSIPLEQGVAYNFVGQWPGARTRTILIPATSTAEYRSLDNDVTPVPPSPGILGDPLVSGLIDNADSDTRAAIIALAGDPEGISDELIADKVNTPSLTQTALDGKYASVDGIDEIVSDAIAGDPGVITAATEAVSTALTNLGLTPQVRTNLALNPDAVNAGSWAASPGTQYSSQGRVTDVVRRDASTSVKLVRNSASPSTTVAAWAFVGNVVADAANSIPVTPGETYAFSVWLRTNRAAASQGRIQIRWYDAAGAQIGGSNTFGTAVPMVANTWAQAPCVAAAPALAARASIISAQILTTSGVLTVSGEQSWAQDALIEHVGAVGSYFDGGMVSDNGTTYAWTGTPNESTSTATTVLNAAVDPNVAGFLNDPASDTAIANAATIKSRDGVIAPAFAATALGSQPAVLQDQARIAKGGPIGTSGKGVIAIRFDHKLDPLLSLAWPVLRDRGIPAAVGVVSRYPSGDPESVGTTSAELKQAMIEGLEIWSHSATHIAQQADGYARLVQEVVTSKSEIEALLPTGKVKGWQQPGGLPGTPSDVPGWANDLDRASKFDTPYGQLLLSTYGLIEAYFDNMTRRVLPSNGCLGGSHLTMDQMSVATFKIQVDQVAANPRCGIEFMLHCTALTSGGTYMTTAQFTECMDYLAAARDAGLIEILTPSGLAFADPFRTDRLDLVTNPTFDGITDAASATANRWPLLATYLTAGTVTATSGVAGTGYDNSTTYLTVEEDGPFIAQAYNQLNELGYGGETFTSIVAAKASSAAVMTVTVKDTQDSSRLNYSPGNIAIPGDDTWRLYRMPFTVPLLTQRVRVEVSMPGSSSTPFDVGGIWTPIL